MVSQPNLSALEQSWFDELTKLCVTSQVCSRARENGTSWKDLSAWPS